MTTQEAQALDPRVPFAPFASWKGGRPAGWFDLPMTPEKVQFFKDNGFVVIDNGADPDVQNRLIRETAELCRGERGPVKGVTPADPNDSDDDVLAGVLCIHLAHKISPVMLTALAHPVIARAHAVIGPM